MCRAAEPTDRGIVGKAGSEATDSSGTGGDSVDAVDITGVPYMDVPCGFGTTDGPVEGGSGVGDGGSAQVGGSEAGQAVGDEVA